MWVPPAPSKDDGIKEVVLSPTFGRKVGSPVRLDDLIKPEERKTGRKSYVVGESEFRQAEKFRFGVGGVSVNERRAKKWAEAAASLSNPAAEALCLSEGWNGLSQNRAAGFQRLHEVAMDGHVGAITHLGAALHERGDRAQAAAWLHRGVSMDHSPAKALMDRLGLSHIEDAPEGELMAAARTKLEEDLAARTQAKLDAEQAAKEKAAREARDETDGADDNDDAQEDTDTDTGRAAQREEPRKKSGEGSKLEEMWLAVDEHQSGALNRAQVASVLSKMGLQADDETLDEAMTGTPPHTHTVCVCARARLCLCVCVCFCLSVYHTRTQTHTQNTHSHSLSRSLSPLFLLSLCRV